MHIAHLSAWRVPVELYGGSQRVVYWQAKAQAALGHRVSVLAPPGSNCPGVEIIAVPPGAPYAQCIPASADVAHVHGLVPVGAQVPYLITTQGNSPGEMEYLPNKVYGFAAHMESRRPRQGTTRPSQMRNSWPELRSTGRASFKAVRA